MLSTRITTALFLGPLVCLGFSFGIASPACFAQPQPSAADKVPAEILTFLAPLEIAAEDSELTQKLKERHNVGVALLNERLEEYRTGIRSIEPVFEAARLAADAKLDLAENDESRIAALEKILGIAKLFEARLDQQVQAGFGSKAELHRARFGRLSVEVELLKLKAVAPAAA